MVAAAAAVLLLLLNQQLPAGGRVFRCACTLNCPESSSGTCFTEHQCFTQYTADGVEPVAFGCLTGRTPLLCEDWVQTVGEDAAPRPKSAVVCCEWDLCNRRVVPTPPMNSAADASTQFPHFLLSHIISGNLTDGKFSKQHRMYPLDKPVVLSLLFVGLLLLVALLSFGFYLLHKQSQTMKRIWKSRNPGELSLSLVEGTQSTC